MAAVPVHQSTPGDDFELLVAKYNAAVALINEMRTNINALLAKLDADAGVTDTNYAATLAIASAVADTVVLTY